jgi:hypothetical protein
MRPQPEGHSPRGTTAVSENCAHLMGAAVKWAFLPLGANALCQSLPADLVTGLLDAGRLSESLTRDKGLIASRSGAPGAGTVVAERVNRESRAYGEARSLSCDRAVAHCGLLASGVPVSAEVYRGRSFQL